MSLPKIGFNSYVDIATCMVIQHSDYRRLHQSVSDRCEEKGSRESTLDLSEADFETGPPDLLKLEWSKRIKQWQRLHPDNGPLVEGWTSLKEFKFGAFFLQHPISAMSLWNVMQTFYALDHFVCCTSKESQDKVTEWESMPPFEYLDASRVEKRWRTSLQHLRKEIESEKNRDALLPRTDGMLFGVVKLEDACVELRRSLKENLKGVKLVASMLHRIRVAAGRRFSMIDTYLRMDENHLEEIMFDDAIEDTVGSVDSTNDPKFEKPKIPALEESRIFKPLSRANSIEAIKHHLLLAWVSTKKGEATLSAVVIVLMLLMCLHQLQACLIIIPQP